MSEQIDSIIRTRKIITEIICESLQDINNKSEFELSELILSKISANNNLFTEGYYNPPPAGISILFDQKPFKRLKYDSLRNPENWPSKTLKYSKETVGMIYFSPVDCHTNMLGDIGFTIYQGENKEIKKHIKKSYDAILAIAQYAQEGMSFVDLCSFANDSLRNKFKITRWITVNSNPAGMNLGHTIPGSYENLNFGKSFEEVRETITKKRIFIKETEGFKIMKNCAFTIESRLEDIHKSYLPSVHFHFIVCFDDGKKTIIENFKEIFKTIGMDYMNIK